MPCRKLRRHNNEGRILNRWRSRSPQNYVNVAFDSAQLQMTNRPWAANARCGACRQEKVSGTNDRIWFLTPFCSPLIVHWPGVTNQGAVCREPVIVMDLLPTLLGATGIELPDDVTFDGLNLTPLLKDPSAKLDREALHFHYPHYYSTTTPVSAVRSRDWKLVRMGGRKGPGNAQWELYDLSKDLSEETNLAKSKPERLTELVELWEKMNGEMVEPLF
jgi:hypothetical protein